MEGLHADLSASVQRRFSLFLVLTEDVAAASEVRPPNAWVEDSEFVQFIITDKAKARREEGRCQC